MDVNEAASLLKNVPLFAGCTRRELEEIARAVKEVRHKEGHVIAQEGDTGIGFFLITDGTAAVSVGGKTRAQLKRGDFFGEIALLDRGPRTATVEATSPIEMLGLTAWAFRGLVEQHPTIALNMLKVVAQRLRSVSGTPTS